MGKLTISMAIFNSKLLSLGTQSAAGGDFGPRQGRRRSAGRHGGDPRDGPLRGACAAAAAGATGGTVWRVL